MEGPWTQTSAEALASEWEIAILPFKPLKGVSPNFLNARRARVIKREDLAQLSTAPTSVQLTWTNSERLLFQTSFKELQALIQQGLVTKGVPWAYQSAPWENACTQWMQFLARARAISPNLTLYGAELSAEAVLGATPEWLFRIEAGGRTLHTLALAGTRWVNQSRPEAQEKKDAREHQLVVEDIREKLLRFGRVTTGECTWKKAGSIEHLHTPITLEANEKLDVAELLSVLHPTPAVGVTPHTPAALAWQDKLPGHEQRADFAAPWVVRNRVDGRAWALVALRQIRLRPDHVIIPAGCGVIADSIEEVEWNEIQEKILSVKRAWGLAD